MVKGALKAAALACAFSSCSAFAPAVVGGKIASQHNKLSLSNRARAPTRAGVAATSMDLGLLAGVPLMYCLMSANEYVTHRYYQHNEVGKLEIYQTLRKMGKIPKLDGGGHIEHHAETYDDMSLKTDNPVWMASAPAQRMVGNKYRGTAFTWGVTRDMCLQCVPTVFPAFWLLGWSIPATLALWLPAMAVHGLIWNALHPNMHGLPDVPAKEGLPSSWLAGLRGSPVFEYLRLNHVGHHVASGKVNYNVCCPGMDHLVGTYMPVEEWKPLVREREIKEVEGALAGSAM
jgi:hypothetical protein